MKDLRAMFLVRGVTYAVSDFGEEEEEEVERESERNEMDCENGQLCFCIYGGRGGATG